MADRALVEAPVCIANECDHPATAFYIHDVPLTNGWPVSRGTLIYFGPVVGAAAFCHHHAYERGPAWGAACVGAGRG